MAVLQSVIRSYLHLQHGNGKKQASTKKNEGETNNRVGQKQS